MEVSSPNVLAARYASERMRALWSPERRVVLERRLWLAVLEAQRTLGLDVPHSAVEAYEAVVEVVDLKSIAARETITRHDVKARIDEFCALAGHEQIHLGMTSRDLTENAEQLQILESLKAIRDDLVAVIARLADLAEGHASTVMVARTHNVAAQATTLGKRFADAATETMLAYARIDELLRRYPLRGIKGPVGTRLDQLDLLGSVEAVDELEHLVAQHLDFGRVLDATGTDLSALAGSRCGGCSSAGHLRAGVMGDDDPAHGRARPRVRGVPVRPGRVLGDAPQGERPILGAHRCPADRARRPSRHGSVARGAPVERG